MAKQERVQKAAQRPEQTRASQTDQQDRQDSSGARQWVRKDIATTWWPEGS